MPGLKPRFSGSESAPRGEEAEGSQRPGRARDSAETGAGCGRRAQAHGAAVLAGLGAGCWVPATSRLGSEMASQPPSAPLCSESLDDDLKTVSELRTVKLPLMPSSDLEHLFRKLPAVIRAYGRFKLLTLEARQNRLLAPLDPLEVSKDSPPPEEHPKSEKKFWGDQETLSKVRPQG